MKSEVMRDVLIGEIGRRMKEDETIFFLSADFGSPALDQVRNDFSDRFINVGIAEQNLVSVAAGLGIEGFTVYAYAIAPFLSMRAFEQIRISLAIMAQQREVNVNLIGVGAGLSYDVTGPTHHCLEDIAIMRVLPNMSVISPADSSLMADIVTYTLTDRRPSYIRLDGKALPRVLPEGKTDVLARGGSVLRNGEKVCLVATGYMTHVALQVADELRQQGVAVGVLDVLMLSGGKQVALAETLAFYDQIVTMEEGFVHRGGLDALVHETAVALHQPSRIHPLGFRDSYVFEVGDRRHLHHVAGLGTDEIVRFVRSLLT